MKTYLIGYTKNGAIVARASSDDQGYTHAAVRTPTLYTQGQVVPTSGAAFSRSLHGAAKTKPSWQHPAVAPEIVEVAKVEGAEYRRLTGKS